MSSMSNYMQKGKSSNFASASTAFASETMTTPTLTRTRSIIPNAPYKAPHSLHRGVEQGEQGEVNNGLQLRRTYSAMPGSGQVGGFIMGPQAGAMLGIENRLISPSTERMRRSPTPVLGETGELYTRSRSPTLANLNEALSPRTDLAVSGLKSLSQEDAVFKAIDSEGNVDVTALNANTVLNATKENARAKYLQALNDLNDAAENCLNIEGANWPSYFHTHLKEVSVLQEYMKFKGNGVEEPVEEPKRQCTGCLTDQPNQMAHSCLGFASAENTQEEIEPLNRSFTPEPLPVPKPWDIYKRKERVGEPYAWVRRKQAPRTKCIGPQVEYMQPGYKVVVNKQWDYECNGVKRYVMFGSQEGILCKDLGSTSESQTKYYIAELDDFHKHMELVSEEGLSKEKPSVEQTSGGSMSEEQSRSRLASLDALQRAQANAKDSNDLPINDKKRKAVDNPEEDMAEEVEEASTGVFVALTVKTYQEIEQAFNKVNVGKLITYVPHAGMDSMLHYKVVKKTGMMQEPDLIGIEPPHKFKNTPDWQNGCWFIPKAICRYPGPKCLTPTKKIKTHTWHSVSDLNMRRKMIRRIATVMVELKSSEGNGWAEEGVLVLDWASKLPKMACRFEEKIYRSSETKESYENPLDLKKRLTDIAKEILKRV